MEKLETGRCQEQTWAWKDKKVRLDVVNEEVERELSEEKDHSAKEVDLRFSLVVAFLLF